MWYCSVRLQCMYNVVQHLSLRDNLCITIHLELFFFPNYYCFFFCLKFVILQFNFFVIVNKYLNDFSSIKTTSIWTKLGTGTR